MAISRFTGGIAAVALAGAALVAAPATAFAQPTGAVVVPCSTSALDSAISAANTSLTATTLQLSSNCTYAIVTPAVPGEGLPPITNDITLAGGANTVITRSALTPHAFGLLQVARTGDLTVSNLTLTNGSILVGGAIYDLGRLSVTNSRISGNFAYHGAAIFVANDGTASISGTLISHNLTPSFGNGAIDVLGSLELFNTVIDSNTSGDGGALSILKGSVTTEQTTITSNTAEKSGGGIFNTGGTLSLNGSQVRLNTAGATAGGIYSTNTNVTLQSTIVKKNTPDNCTATAFCLN